MARGAGDGWTNRAKRLENPTPGPWTAWPSSWSRATRAVTFIERFCRPPKGYGAREPMRLAPFQRDWLEEVLADGVNSAAMAIARGNGKSTFLAGLGTWALFDEDEGGAPQIPIVATKVMQAYRSVYGVALAMIEAEPELAERCLIYTASNAMKVTAPMSGGEMFPAANDVAGLQGLDPSLAICDEVGFMPVEAWDSLLLASGKRPRSLVVGIGTPGFDRDNALWHLRQRVHEGASIPGFRFTEFAAAEGCAISDEEQWARANPALPAGYLNPDALRTAAALSPEGSFRIFHLGQWVDGVESWLGDDGRRLWDSLAAPYTPVSSAPTYVGVDVGLTRDSTAVVAVQARPDGRWYAWCRLWVPTPDRPVDVTDVMHHLRQLDQQFVLAAVAYDPRLFDVPAITLLDEGLPMVEIPQSVERMTPACGTAYELIQRGELTHDGDPGFAGQVLNAMARFNERGFVLAKGKSRGRIDAAIALVLALDRAVREPPAEAAYVL